MLVGRPHLVGILALQSGTSCKVQETNSGEVRYNQVMAQQGREILVSVKGGFTVTSSAIENLVVTIDGVPYQTPELIGRQTASFPDADTVPPAQPVAAKSSSAKSAPSKSAPTKTTTRPR